MACRNTTCNAACSLVSSRNRRSLRMNLRSLWRDRRSLRKNRRSLRRSLRSLRRDRRSLRRDRRSLRRDRRSLRRDRGSLRRNSGSSRRSLRSSRRSLRSLRRDRNQRPPPPLDASREARCRGGGEGLKWLAFYEIVQVVKNIDAKISSYKKYSNFWNGSHANPL